MRIPGQIKQSEGIRTRSGWHGSSLAPLIQNVIKGRKWCNQGSCCHLSFLGACRLMPQSFWDLLECSQTCLGDRQNQYLHLNLAYYQSVHSEMIDVQNPVTVSDNSSEDSNEQDGSKFCQATKLRAFAAHRGWSVSLNIDTYLLKPTGSKSLNRSLKA